MGWFPGSPVVTPFEASTNLCHKNQGCLGSLCIAKVSEDTPKGKGRGIVLGMSVCSVELQRGVRFVASDHPLFVKIPVVTCVKEKMEPDQTEIPGT